MKDAFVLQDDVPLPPIDRRPRASTSRRSWQDAINNAAVGQFFFVPERSAQSVSAYVARIAKDLDSRFETRRVWAWFDHRRKIWHLCKHDAVGAVEGVGVWRTM